MTDALARQVKLVADELFREMFDPMTPQERMEFIIAFREFYCIECGKVLPPEAECRCEKE